MWDVRVEAHVIGLFISYSFRNRQYVCVSLCLFCRFPRGACYKPICFPLYRVQGIFWINKKRSLFITICFRNDQSAARVHSLFRLPRSLELQSVPLYSILARSQSHVDGFFVFVELVHFLEQLGHLRVTVANFREYALRRARVCPRHYFSCFAPHIYIVF
jgi:hypothetical protein